MVWKENGFAPKPSPLEALAPPDLKDDCLDVEDDRHYAATPDRFDVENDLQQEHDLGTAQAAIPAARPVSHTGVLSQADSGTTTTKRRGRPPGSRNKKTLQTEAAIAGAMQAGGTQGRRDEALQALQAALSLFKICSVGITQGKKRAGRLGQKITLQERRSHRLASGNGFSDVVAA